MKNQEEILKDNPGSIIFARYAEQLAGEGKIDEALKILENGIKANPNYASAHSILANIYFMQESDEKAAEELKSAINLDPQMPHDLFLLGKHYLQQDQAAKAMTYLWAAQRFEPVISDVKNAYEEARTLKESQEDLQLTEQSEKALSELGDMPEGAETLVAGETEEEIEAPESAEAEELIAEEPPSVDEIAEEDTGVQTFEEEISEDVSEQAEIPEIEEQPEETGGEDLAAMLGEIETPVPEAEEEIEAPESAEAEELIAEEPPSVDEIAEEDTGVQTFEEEISEDVSEQAEIPEIGEQPEETGDENLAAMLGEIETPVPEAEEEIEAPESAEAEELIAEEPPSVDEIAEEDTGVQTFEEEITAGVPGHTGIPEIEEKPEETGDEEFDAMLGEIETPVPEAEEEIEAPESAEAEELMAEEPPSVDELAEEQPEEVGDEEFDAMLGEIETPVPEAEEEIEAPESAEAEELMAEEPPSVDELAEEQPEEVGDEEFDAMLGEIETPVPEAEEKIEAPESAEAEELMAEEPPSVDEPAEEETDVHAIEEDVTENFKEHPEMPEGELSDQKIAGAGSGDQPVTVNILEINEDEEYNLENFELDSSAASVDKEPVLSDEERAELKALESIPEQPESDTIEDTLTAEIETEEEQETAEETLPGIETESSEENEPEAFYSELSKEEIDILSSPPPEQKEKDVELEQETNEGIDYSDVLSDTSLTGDVEETRTAVEDEPEKSVEEKEDMLSEESEETHDYFPPESGEETFEDAGGVVTEEKPSAAEPGVSEDAPETETPDTDASGESYRIVEELIKSAPDIELPAAGEQEEDVSGSSLGELISDYEKTLEESAEFDQTEPPERPGYVEDEAPAESISEEIEETDEEVTATMAEIYVSQGLTGQAIKIYEAILKKEPDDETAKSRLDELRKSQEQQPGDS